MKAQVAGLAMDVQKKILLENADNISGVNAYDQFLKDAGDSHDSKNKKRSRAGLQVAALRYAKVLNELGISKRSCPGGREYFRKITGIESSTG